MLTLTRAEQTSLEAVLERLESLRDRKLEVLIELLRDSGPSVVFTERIPTRDIAATAIVEKGLGPCALYGGECAWTEDEDEPTRMRAADLLARVDSGDARVFVTTPAGAQGLNLQRFSAAVHLDMPWTPADLDQREGRICRPGQKAPAVRITRLRYAGTVEDRNWELLLTKGLGIRNVLGNVTRSLDDALTPSDSWMTGRRWSNSVQAARRADWRTIAPAGTRPNR